MRSFRPTPTQVRLAEVLMTIMARESMIRPVVEQYETAILAKHQWRIAREWVAHGTDDHVILDRKESFLLSTEDFQRFFDECSSARDAANLVVERPGNCPLLETENLRIQAENALLQSMGGTPGLEAFAAGGWTLELRAKAIDLVLKLLAPSCRDADEILQGYVAAGSPDSIKRGVSMGM